MVIEVRETEVFARWFRELRDQEARHRVLARIRRLSLDNPGDVRPVGEGVSEVQIDYGPGYRAYFYRRTRHEEAQDQAMGRGRTSRQRCEHCGLPRGCSREWRFRVSDRRAGRHRTGERDDEDRGGCRAWAREPLQISVARRQSGALDRAPSRTGDGTSPPCIAGEKRRAAKANRGLMIRDRAHRVEAIRRPRSDTTNAATRSWRCPRTNRSLHS
jgi:putative addiction module killer protein